MDTLPFEDLGCECWHQPSVMEIVKVKRMFFSHTPLPGEIVDLILDAAEYWPHTSQATDFHVSTPSGSQIVTGASNVEDKLMLRCSPVGFFRYPGCPGRPRDYKYGSLPQSKLRSLRNQYDPLDFHQYLYRQPCLRRLDNPCRKIVFTITSRDQGWGGNHRATLDSAFSESHTWFEVGLERFEKYDNCTDGCKTSSPDPSRPLSQSDSEANMSSKATEHLRFGAGDSDQARPHTLSLCHLRPVIPALRPCTVQERSSLNITGDEEAYMYNFSLHPDENFKIQCNKRSSRVKETYKIVWRSEDCIDPTSPKADLLERMGNGRATGDGKFVRELKLGDVVTVWAKARYPAWVNHVDSVKVDIYWAI